MLSVEDALASITRYFTEANGLVAQIERGEGVDTQHVQEIREAFQTLQTSWLNESHIPKKGARVIRKAVQMLTAVEQYAFRYPEQSAEISAFLPKAYEWIENVFISPPEPMAEEVAISLLTGHILGVPSFNVQLIQGRIDEDAAKELLEAVSALEFHWKGRETISKLAAQALIGAPWLFERVSTYYSDAEREQLQDIEKQLAEHITRCLR